MTAAEKLRGQIKAWHEEHPRQRSLQPHEAPGGFINPGGRMRRLRWIDYDNAVALRLFDTDVVTYGDDAVITLWDGGWATASTREAMNLALAEAEYVHLRVCMFQGCLWACRLGTWPIGNRRTGEVPDAHRLDIDHRVRFVDWDESHLRPHTVRVPRPELVMS